MSNAVLSRYGSGTVYLSGFKQDADWTGLEGHVVKRDGSADFGMSLGTTRADDIIGVIARGDKATKGSVVVDIRNTNVWWALAGGAISRGDEIVVNQAGTDNDKSEVITSSTSGHQIIGWALATAADGEFVPCTASKVVPTVS